MFIIIAKFSLRVHLRRKEASFPMINFNQRVTVIARITWFKYF